MDNNSQLDAEVQRILDAANNLCDGGDLRPGEEFIAAILKEKSNPDFDEKMACALADSAFCYNDLTFDLLDALVDRKPNDKNILRRHTFAAWVHYQFEPANHRALNSARRYLSIAPDDINAYRLLALTATSCGEYREAFLAASAAMALVGRDVFVGLRQLTRFLMQGIHRVSFNHEGLQYIFDLAPFSTQAVDGSSMLAVGQISEIEELKYVSQFVGTCESIVEVGALLGNHTVFFMKNLKPKQIFVFDANPKACAQIRINTDLNQEQDRHIDVQITNAFIGNRAIAAIPFSGTMVPAQPLPADIIPAPGFIKIDVDGGELDVLEGAESLLMSARPKVMIEVNAVTEARVETWFADRGFAKCHEIGRAGYKNLFFR